MPAFKWEEEVWKPIKHFESLYEVSNFGRIRSLTRKVKHGNSHITIYGKMMKQVPNEKGYLMVRLSKNGKGKIFKVHRLVAQAFLNNPHGYQEINHLNEIRDDNHVSNLEWCSHSHNLNYGHRTQKFIQAVSTPIIQLSSDSHRIAAYSSANQASKITGISQGNISAVVRGKRNYAGGYKWQKLEKEVSMNA